MPNYERWKYCQCGNTADHECNCGTYHPDEDFSGWACPPPDSAKSKHPKWICDKCLDTAEAAEGE